MIHQIFPHQLDNQFIPDKECDNNDYVFHYKGDSMLLKSVNNELCLPRRKDIPVENNISPTSFLFTLNDTSCFLVEELPELEEAGFVYKEINLFRNVIQKEIAWAGIVGFQLMKWYGENRFCGKCGSPANPKKEERAIICPACNTTVYPKISPAVIMAIICNDKILLASNNSFRKNWYSLIAGYADVGESLEETVAREAREETGIDVKNIRYFTSQPWPFSGSLMIGFVAEADDQQEIKVDNKELSHAAWFSRGNLPNHSSTISIAGEMIEKFENGEL